jgi:glucosamine-6-phosphate deaminase
MHIHVAPTCRLATLVADRMSAAVAAKPDAYIGLATGATPTTIGLWSELRTRVAGGALDLSAASLVNPDEWLDGGHDQSYTAYLQRHLQGVPTSILLPCAVGVDPLGSAVALEGRIVAGGGFELMLVGMGINGHIGFFEPDAGGLPSTAYAPVLAEENRARWVSGWVLVRGGVGVPAKVTHDLAVQVQLGIVGW